VLHKFKSTGRLWFRISDTAETFRSCPSRAFHFRILYECACPARSLICCTFCDRSLSLVPYNSCSLPFCSPELRPWHRGRLIAFMCDTIFIYLQLSFYLRSVDFTLPRWGEGGPSVSPPPRAVGGQHRVTSYLFVYDTASYSYTSKFLGLCCSSPQYPICAIKFQLLRFHECSDPSRLR